MMPYKKIINIILIILVACLQIAFISALPAPFNNINLAMIVLIFLIFLNDFNLVLTWALALGLVSDFYSFYPFGIYTLTYLLSAIILKIILDHLLTNRSQYSFLAMNIFGVLVFKILLISFLAFYFSIFSEESFFNFYLITQIGYQLALNLVVSFIFFLAAGAITKRFRPEFVR